MTAVDVSTNRPGTLRQLPHPASGEIVDCKFARGILTQGEGDTRRRIERIGIGHQVHTASRKLPVRDTCAGGVHLGLYRDDVRVLSRPLERGQQGVVGLCIPILEDLLESLHLYTVERPPLAARHDMELGRLVEAGESAVDGQSGA